MTTALFPGSFDPFTNGHLDLVQRAAAVFDTVVVAVGFNQAKPGWLPAQLRIRAIEQVVSSHPGLVNVRVGGFEGLTTDYAKECGADVLVKGARTLADWEWEYIQADTNWSLAGFDTFVIPTRPQWSTVSSSIVRELASFGVSTAALVPPAVETVIEQRRGASPAAEGK